MVSGRPAAGLGIALLCAGLDSVRQDRSARSSGIAFRTAADIGLSVAILSGAAAVILLFTDVGKSSSDVARFGTLRW